MSKAKKPVLDYIISQKKLFDFFECEDEYFVKPLLKYNWSVKSDEEYSILSYWTDGEIAKTAVIVRKNGEPMIYEVSEYTMVIGIDCVKIGFVFATAMSPHKLS